MTLSLRLNGPVKSPPATKNFEAFLPEPEENPENSEEVSGGHIFEDPYEGFLKIVGFHPKSSILIGFSIVNHPFWGTTI